MNHDSRETSLGSFCFKPAHDDRQAPHLHIVGRKAPKATDLQHRIKKGPGLFVIDVRDATDIVQTGAISDAVNIFYGLLTYMADHNALEDWCDLRLADHDRPIVTTCTWTARRAGRQAAAWYGLLPELLLAVNTIASGLRTTG